MMFSCAVRETQTAPPHIQFAMKTFRLASKSCDSDSVKCAFYEVKYPEFTGLDSAVAKRILHKIQASVSMGNPEAENWPMDKVAKNFISGYEDFVKENPDAASMNWYYTSEVNVETLTDSLISLSVNEEDFTGGAHGGNGRFFINVNPKTGKEFTLDNLLKPGYQKALTSLGEKAFRQARNLADTAAFADNGFEFPDEQFQLNTNYGFTPRGIEFVFNNYEVAPYALGRTEFVIPYDALKEWLK